MVDIGTLPRTKAHLKFSSATIFVIVCVISTLISTMPYSAWASSSANCRSFFANEGSTESILRNLEIAADGIVPQAFLGSGASGSVLTVAFMGRTYALKIIAQERAALYQDAKTREIFSALEQNEVSDAIVIQSALGKLSIAPAVIGILPAREIQRWLEQHREVLIKLDPDRVPTNPRLGLLMEMIDGVSTKYPKKRVVRLFQSQIDKILAQADEIERTLFKLNISAQDIDAIITEAGVLRLIDISYYRYADVPQNYNFIQGWLRRPVQRLIERGHIIVLPNIEQH